ncbi:MAG TPA: FAD-binding oxidoreductase, partial [Nocardioides sp.]|nr:FAD-binding oxidoreductase [Nocardioides sp.]
MVLRSVWEDDRVPETMPPVEVEGHHDVVVVGGGLTGITTALLLASAGRSVLVLEARHLGAGTTGGSTAKVSALQGTRLSAIARRHSIETVRHYVQGNLEGLAWLRRFCEEHEVTSQTRTAYTYATTDSGARQVEEEHRVATDAGLDAVLTPGLALPFPTTAAVGLPDQMQVDPVELLHVLAGEAVRRGATIVEEARVHRVRGNQPTRVETGSGSVTADVVVVATNLPVLDRGGHFARLKPARSYGLAYRGWDAALDGMYLSADSPTRSLRDALVRGDRVLLVGGEGHTTGRDPSPRRRLEALRSWTAEYFPGLEETHAWSAQDYLPAHELPLVGPVLPDSEHLLMAGGYAKWGLTNSVAASLALASRLLGGRTDWAEAMTGWSRHELTGLPHAALFNAEVGLEMTRGWLAPL